VSPSPLSAPPWRCACRKRMARPVGKRFQRFGSWQSASTYPACGRSPGQDGVSRVLVLITTSACDRHFRYQVARTPVRLSGHLVSTTHRPRQPSARVRTPRIARDSTAIACSGGTHQTYYGSRSCFLWRSTFGLGLLRRRLFGQYLLIVGLGRGGPQLRANTFQPCFLPGRELGAGGVAVDGVCGKLGVVDVLDASLGVDIVDGLDLGQQRLVFILRLGLEASYLLLVDGRAGYFAA
jgi:hypothetical protein